jgi:hypothetical protein
MNTSAASGVGRVYTPSSTSDRNKKSIPRPFDLTTAAGREVFLDLVQVVDVVWENFRSSLPEARLRLPGADRRQPARDRLLDLGLWLVAGEVLKRNGRLVGVDWNRVSRLAHQARDRVVARASFPRPRP